MEINWTRIKDALHNLAEDSGASADYARGCVVSVASCLTALGMDWKTMWSKMVPLFPDALRPQALPSVWIVNCEDDWKLPFSNLVTPLELIATIPPSMREIVVDEYGWTCRDSLLDKYLYVLGIMQRETERAWEEYKKDMWVASEPELDFFFSPWRTAGSQYIAEWAVRDLRKTKSEKINWHGQNTSQWLYAGALCVQDGRVSIHT